MKLFAIALLLITPVAAGCAKTTSAAGPLIGITQPDRDLMINPRRVKQLKEGGDLKKYAIIIASRNGDLVDQVKGLQEYASIVSGSPIINLKEDDNKRPDPPAATRLPPNRPPE